MSSGRTDAPTRPEPPTRSPSPALATMGRALALSVSVLAAAMLVGLALGSTWMPPGEVLAGLLGRGDAATTFVVRAVRLPAVLVAGCVGAALGASGAAMQGLLRNPLADPYLLGISGGAALAASATLGLAPAGVASWLVPPAAFAGALLATLGIVAVARLLPGGLRGRHATYTLLLTGVVFNAFAGAWILLLHTLLLPAQSQEILLWLMGAIVPSRVTGPDALVAVALGGAALLALLRQGRALNLLSLGDDDASGFGLDVARARRSALLATAVVVGCAVAYTGLIGFVGLLVPHLVRLRSTADHRVVLPAAAVLGGAFLILADAVARSLFSVAGTSVPVGVVTALLGVPLFFALLVGHLQTER